MFSRQGSDEDLLAGTSNCDRLRQLEKQFAAGEALIHPNSVPHRRPTLLVVAKEANPRLASLDAEWSKYNEGHPIRLVSRSLAQLEVRL